MVQALYSRTEAEFIRGTFRVKGDTIDIYLAADGYAYRIYFFGDGTAVVKMIELMRDSGDSILAISGIFSGTLSWLFLQFDGTVPFTDLVDQAWQQWLNKLPPKRQQDEEVKEVRWMIEELRRAGYSKV